MNAKRKGNRKRRRGSERKKKSKKKRKGKGKSKRKSKSKRKRKRKKKRKNKINKKRKSKSKNRSTKKRRKGKGRRKGKETSKKKRKSDRKKKKKRKGKDKQKDNDKEKGNEKENEQMKKRKTCQDPGSSRGPADLQPDALPTELSRLLIVCRAQSLTQLQHHAQGGTPKPHAWQATPELYRILLQGFYFQDRILWRRLRHCIRSGSADVYLSARPSHQRGAPSERLHLGLSLGLWASRHTRQHPMDGLGGQLDSPAAPGAHILALRRVSHSKGTRIHTI